MTTVPTYRYGGRSDPVQTSRRWWIEKEPDARAQAMTGIARLICEDQRTRLDHWLAYARLYANQNLGSLYSAGVVIGNHAIDVWGSTGPRLTWNVVQSCIDTAAAKISKNKPRVTFLTSGGDHDMQQRAKGLTKFADGLIYASKLYDEGRKAFVDGCVFGVGGLKICNDGTEIWGERVLPWEVFVDETEAIYGKPRSMYQLRYCHREWVIERYARNDAELKARIKDVSGADPTGVGAMQTDMIPVWEAWHLGEEGRHSIAVEGVELESEHWEKDHFPFAWFRWNPRLVGFWGQGLAEQLIGIQHEINKQLLMIQRGQHLMSVARIALEQGSQITPLTNEIGSLFRYTGNKPEFFVAPAMSPEIYSHLERLVTRAYELTGISQLSAMARKPEGLDAAVALREFHDIESERFVNVAQRYEDMFLGAIRIMVDQGRDLYSRGRAVRVKAPGTRVLEQIAWKDVALKEDAYVMQAYPTSLLPTQPAARMQKIIEYYKEGAFDRETMMRLLDFPDVEQEVAPAVAVREGINRAIHNIVANGEYEPPDEYMQPELAVRIAYGALLKARGEGVPEKRLELLMRWIDEARALLPAAPAPAPANDNAAAMPANDNGAAMTVPAPASPAVPSELPVLPQ